MNKKHILIITPGFPENEDDINCIPPLQEFLLKFSSLYKSSEIFVITLQYPYEKRSYNWNKIKVVSLAGKNNIIFKPLIWFKAISQAKKIHRYNPINIIHSIWLSDCALVGNFLSKKFNCDHFCTLMGQDVKPSNKYLNWLKSSKTKFIALSKNQADLYFKFTGKKPEQIIHWGIDDQPTVNSERDIDFLGAGSLITLKNYSLFIKLAEEAVKINPEVKCVLAGSGPVFSKLKGMVREKKLTENFEFTGLLNRGDIFKLMQRSKILVHPSQFEGFGYVFAEALVNGMNIVSFNVGEARNHPKWHIAKDEKDFINISINLLLSKLDFSGVNIFPLAETVKRYAEIYGV